MSRTFLRSAFFVVCIAAPIQAAPRLLVEFIHAAAMVEVGEPLPATVPFDFDAYDPILAQTYVDWQQQYTPSDVGKTFIAPAQIVAGANQAIASATSKYLLETGPANFSSERSFYLPLHTVTSVERVIDQLVITRTQGEFYFLEAAQRIQIWGLPVPEPQGFCLFGLGIGFCANMRVPPRQFGKTGSIIGANRPS